MTRWRDPESVEQRLFVQQLRLDPRTRDLPWFAVPNGARTSLNQAKILKAEGMQAGVPDLLLPIAAHPASASGGLAIGLAIEMKRPDGKGVVSDTQKAFHHKLCAHGWRVVVCRTAANAWSVVAEYLHFTE